MINYIDELEEFLVEIGMAFVESLNGRISDPSDLSAFSALTEDQLLEPLVGFSAEDLQRLYILGTNTGK